MYEICSVATISPSKGSDPTSRTRSPVPLAQLAFLAHLENAKPDSFQRPAVIRPLLLHLQVYIPGP